MIETKLQLPTVFLEGKGIPQSLYLSEYFCVGSQHQYPTARTDDFGKVVDGKVEEGWSEYGTLRYSKDNRKILWRRVP